MKKTRLLSFALLLLLFAPSCKKQTEKKDVIFMAPYENRTQNWQSFVESARQEFSDTAKYNLHFYYVHTYVGHYWDKREYERDISPLLNKILRNVKKEVGKADIIVLHGDYLAHAAARLDNPLLKESPILCTGVVDPNWKNLLPKMPNVVVMESQPEVKKNLDFIQDLGFSNYVVTVMDSTYIDDHIRECILAEIGNDPEHYRPNLHLEQEDRIHQKNARDPRVTLFPISTMWPEKNDRHPYVSGAFNLNWIFYTQQQETAFLHIKHDAYSTKAMSYNIGSYFTMTPEPFNLPLINALNYCVGGYFTPFPEMWKQVHPIVDKLLSGADPKTIPWGTLKKDYWMDWRLAKNLHPYASDFPKYVHFVNLPWQEKSKATNNLIYFLTILLALVFIVVAIILPLVLSTRQKKQRTLLYQKAREAEKSKVQIEEILSELNAYIWRMLPDKTLVFSPSFYSDFGIETAQTIDIDKFLTNIEEPSRSKLAKILGAEHFSGSEDLELLLYNPEQKRKRAILLHVICIANAFADNNSRYHLKAGFFYFNDDAHKRNADLRRAYRRSEEVNEKEQFLASMDETVRNTSDRIVFFSKLLTDHFNDLNSKQKEECSEEVLNSNNKLMALLDDVMGKSTQNNYKAIPISSLVVSDLMEEIYISHSTLNNKKNRLLFNPGPADSKIEANRPVLIQVMDNLITDAVNSCKGKIFIGWAEKADLETILFIDNATGELSKCKQMIESIGGKITLIELPDSPIRIEISFPFTPPLRNNDVLL